LSDKNNELNEKINSLIPELKKLKEEKTNIAFKNGLTEKKFTKQNSENKKIIEQKEFEIKELNKKLEDVKLKNHDMEKQKNVLQNKIFNFMSKINDLSSNYENLQKERESEINKNKENLIQKEKILDDLRTKNRQFIDKIALLENNMKTNNGESLELKKEITKLKSVSNTFDFKMKQSEKTISYLNKQNENLIKDKSELEEKIKQLNKDIKEQKKPIPNSVIKMFYEEPEQFFKEEHRLLENTTL